MQRNLFSVLLGIWMTTMVLAATETVTLIADPQILRIPIAHSDEPLIDLRYQTLIAIGPSPEIPNNQDYTFLRETLYHKLVAAQKRLPPGYHFCLYEGYRSLALQKMIFDKHYANVANKNPTWSKTEVFYETTKLVSPVVNQDGSNNIPPHATGAAIDVYLLDDHGNAMDMGIHPKDWMADEGGVLSLTASHIISPEAQKNRQIMAKALNAEGFVNYPTEYWHWSYGDRYWAFITQHPHALYDLTHK